MTRALRIIVGFVGCSALCGVAGAALGAEDPEALIRQGVALRKAGEDARAEGYFRRAYQLAATPRTAAQLGLVELAVSDYLNAETHLSEALANQDAWIQEHVAILEESRSSARKHLLRVELVGAPPGATVSVAGEKPRPWPAEGVLWVLPERSTLVRIEAPQHKEAIVEARGASGAIQRITIEMPVLEVRPIVPAVVAYGETTTPQPGPAPGRRLRIAGVATGIAGVAVGVAGAVLYAQGVARLHDYQAAIRSDGKIPWNPDDADWEGRRDAGGALLITGGVAVAAGATLFLLGHRAEGGEGGLAFAPGRAGGVFMYRGAF